MRGTTTRRWNCTCAPRSHGELRRLTNTRGLRRRGQLLAGRPVDCVLLHARGVRPRALGRRTEAARAWTRAYFGEIYLMRADARDASAKRLTSVPGYDGGPFFSPDGTRIIWRRFDERGLIADVWTMKLDGTDARQITNFGSMSWAPYFHPSGRVHPLRVNKLGLRELRGVHRGRRRTQGARARDLLGRVRRAAGAVADGQQLAWTSSRGGGREGQIFLAQWNHERARAALAAAPPRKDAMTHRTVSSRSRTQGSHAPASLGCRAPRLALGIGLAHAQPAPATSRTTRDYVRTLASDGSRDAQPGHQRRAEGGASTSRRS